MTGQTQKVLQIIVEDTDRHEGQPLYEAIVRFLQKRGIAGATVWSGIMGYGANRRIHRKGLFGVSDQKPVIITAIDSEKKIRAHLQDLLAMIPEGVALLQDAEVFVRVREGESE